MEEGLHSINNIKVMEIIDVNTGSKLGFIKDLVVDCNDHKILALVVPIQKISWFTKNNSLEIPWERVKKIGTDVILVDGSNLDIEK